MSEKQLPPAPGAGIAVINTPFGITFEVRGPWDTEKFTDSYWATRRLSELNTKYWSEHGRS